MSQFYHINNINNIKIMHILYLDMKMINNIKFPKKYNEEDQTLMEIIS